MTKNTLLCGLAAIALLGLGACSSSSPTPAPATADTKMESKPAGPPQPVAAKEAYYEMYTPARKWSQDIQGVSLVSGELPGVKNADGKAGCWTAVFGSPSLRQARTFVYCVADSLPAYTKGVKEEGTDAWAPNAKAMPFENTDFKIDSDAAYKTAAGKAGDWLKDHADKELVMTLGNATRYPNPVWYFLWG